MLLLVYMRTINCVYSIDFGIHPFLISHILSALNTRELSNGTQFFLFAYPFQSDLADKNQITTSAVLCHYNWDGQQDGFIYLSRDAVAPRGGKNNNKDDDGQERREKGALPAEHYLV